MGENVKPIAATKPLSKQLRFWYGFGDFGFTLMTNVETYYWNAFLTNVAGFTTALAGMVTGVSTIIDLITSWMFGGIINAVKPGKHGRYRTWLLLITWVVPFVFACEFIKFGDNDTLAAVIICIASIVAHACWNFPWSANASMIAVAGQTPEGRASLASSRATWNNLSGVVFSYLFVGVSFLCGTAVHLQYPVGAFIFGWVMFIGYFVHFKITKGYEEIEDPKNPKQHARSATPKDWAIALGKNPQLIVLVISNLATYMVKFLVAAAAVYYFTYAMGTDLQVNYVFLANIMGVVGAFLIRFIAKKVGNRNALIISYAFMAVLFLLAYFNYMNPMFVFVAMIIAQMGYGGSYAAAPALYGDCAVYSRWKTGSDTTGFIMGLQTLPLKLGAFLRATVLNLALGAAGYDAFSAGISDGSITAADLPNTLKQGVCGAFSLWPAIFCIVGAALLLIFYRLNKAKVDRYQAEIDAREMGEA